MGFIFNTFLKYLLVDFWLIVVSFICMYFVFTVYLPAGTKSKRKWVSLLLVEATEHLIVPLILLITLITTNSWITAAIFHLVLVSFLFLFIGLIVVKAKTKGDWFRITAIAAFAYFFIFVYPFILIYVQLHSSIRGWIIMVVTIILFFGLYLMKNRKPKDLSSL